MRGRDYQTTNEDGKAWFDESLAQAVPQYDDSRRLGSYFAQNDKRAAPFRHWLSCQAASCRLCIPLGPQVTPLVAH